MALKETLDITFNIVAPFGYAAWSLTAVKLARQAWQIWGPSTVKEPFSPELRAQMECNKHAFDELKVRTVTLLKQECAPS